MYFYAPTSVPGPYTISITAQLGTGAVADHWKVGCLVYARHPTVFVQISAGDSATVVLNVVPLLYFVPRVMSHELRLPLMLEI